MRESERMDKLLDLLAEEVAARLRVREVRPEPPAAPPRPSEVAPAVAQEPLPVVEEEATDVRPEPLPPPAPTHAAQFLGRLALAVLALVVLINIPLSRHGTTLATAMPDRAALVLRDGLVVKEASEEDIYVYQGGQFRWISSLDAFEHYGYKWSDVHVVEDGFLDEFEKGPPLHVLLKCKESPHIYRLEGGQKRWIVDIRTFTAEGHVWEDVRFVPCSYLRNLPDGETIPPGHGPPPQP